MATATASKSKVYTISLPPELAQRAEALAQRDSRTMSELFREAFRTYSAQQARTTLDELSEYAAGCNPKGYTEADVPRLIKEARAERPRRRKGGPTGDRHRRHKRLDFRTSICERLRHADAGA